MNTTVIPGTEMSVSRLSFGAARLHHLPTSGRRQALLAAAADHGFLHFDTAPVYGLGLCEEELGKFLRARGPHLTVASKVGMYSPFGRRKSALSVWLQMGAGRMVPALSSARVDWSVAAAAKSLERSRRALRRDCLDVLLLHGPEAALLDTEEFYGWLQRQKKAGNLRYWGLTGPIKQVAAWLHPPHPLAQVLQVRDASDGAGTRALAEAGREPQFTYGCLAAARGKDAVAQALKSALERNPHGSVLVSTRQIPHLRMLAEAAR